MRDYDALNRRFAELDAYGTSLQRTLTTVYDADGNVTASIDALGYRTTYGYDALNRRVTVQDAAGGVATTVYDPNSNVVNGIDQLSHTTTYAYDVLNRKTQTTDARAGVVTMAYDANNNLLSLTDPVNNLTQWQYDALDRKAQEIDPLSYSATYAYDAANRMTLATDRVRQQIAYGYDLLNRETGETWYNAAGATVNLLTFSYDPNNNLLTAANNAATSTMAYDALDRKASVQDVFGAALTYSYDAANNRTLVQDSFGATTTRVYDVLNRTTTMLFGGVGQTPLREDFTYTVRDQVATQTRYSNLTGTTTIGYSTFSYDALGRPTNLQHQNGAGGNIANYTNTYDLASRITSETLNGGAATTYSYDATNELTNDAVATYSYDLNGNRTMAGYTTGPANELAGDGTWQYYYDANGNRVGKANTAVGTGANLPAQLPFPLGTAGAAAYAAWNYGYDNRNRLVSAQETTSRGVQVQATYVYDALGRRIEKDVTQAGVATTTRFAYNGSEAWADLTSANALLTRYVRGDRVLELLARVSGGGTAAWLLADRMGSVRNVVDNTGAVLDIIAYDGYGNLTNETSAANGGAYKYVGYRYDSETGLYKPDPSTARYYVPATGNWNGRDPWGFVAGDANLYRMVGNNPVNYLDPDGLQSLSLRTFSDPKVTDCGGFTAWWVRFQLSEKSKAGGWIVQHFTIEYNVYGCDDCKKKIEHPKKFSDPEYWEAWEVKPKNGNRSVFYLPGAAVGGSDS